MKEENKTTSKKVGEAAELAVAALLSKRCFNVCLEAGDSATWDLISEYKGTVNRIQVKSSSVKPPHTDAIYYIRLIKSGAQKYAKNDFDFLCASLPWGFYVIPEAVCLKHKSNVYGFWEQGTHLKGKECEFEKYREAWHLLQ